MGMHPKATSLTPFFPGEFPSPHAAIRPFYRWWDALSVLDVPAALDAIWPRKVKR